MSHYDIKITGKDVKRFIHNLHKMHINLLNIELEKNSVLIKVSEEDYKKIKDIKTIYDIKVVKTYGIARVKEFIKKYFIFLTCLSFGLLLILGLTNVIFEVEVIHNNKELREIILEELEKEGISKYRLVVSYEKKEKIKENILKKYKNQIEWIEIERQGTRYEIKVEERKLKQEETTSDPSDVVAKKDGIIHKITSSQGEIVAKKDQYVKKGDVLISGTIHNKEEVVGFVKAEGKVLAETWYTVTVELPYHYHEEKLLEENQKTLEIKWFNKTLNLFRFKNYKDSKKEELYSLKNPLLPISISIFSEQKVKIIDKIYTKDNTILEANSIAKKRLKEKLDNNIEILYEKNLKITEEDSKIIVVMFYKVLENITSYQNIEITQIPEKEEEKR